MATILELGYKNGDVFQPLSLEYYTPIYYTNWEFDSEKSIIYNKEPIKFNVNPDEEITINCLSITTLKYSISLTNTESDDVDFFSKFGEVYDLFPDIENEVIFEKADLQINVS